MVASPFLYDEADTDWQGFWARQAADLVDLVRGVAHDPRVEPAVREVVRRRQAQRLPQRARPSRRGRPRRQGRVPLGRRAGRHAHDHLRRSARRGEAVRERAEVTRCGEGRPRRDLHADDPRAAGRDAGLRAHRRAALGGVRRLRARLARPTASTTRSARSSSPPTAASGAGAPSLLKPNVDVALASTPSIEHVVVVQRTKSDVSMTDGPRPLVPRPHGVRGGESRLPGGADGQRGPALPPVHVGHDGQAQGHHAHDGRLPHAGRVHAQVRVRPPPRHRRVLVRGRHRLGDRAQLHRVRPADQRRHVGDLRRHARHARRATGSGRSPRSTASRSSTPRPPRSARS